MRKKIIPSKRKRHAGIGRAAKMKLVLSQLNGKHLREMTRILADVPTPRLQREYDKNIDKVMQL